MTDFEEAQKLVESMVGCSILRAEWDDPNADADWTSHEEARLWLSDGRVIEFGAWGYDAWGATVEEIRLVDVDVCLHCKQSHKELHVFSASGYGDGLQRSHAHAFCIDGNHVAWAEMS